MIRSLLRWLIAGAAIGLAVPVVLQLLAKALDNMAAVPNSVLSAFDYVQLMFWPTPMIMLPADEPGSPDLNSFGPFTLATLGNAALYAWVSLRIIKAEVSAGGRVGRYLSGQRGDLNVS